MPTRQFIPQGQPDEPRGKPLATSPEFQRVRETGQIMGPTVKTPNLAQQAPSVETQLAAMQGTLESVSVTLQMILQELREQVQRGYAYPVTLLTQGLVPVELVFDPALFSLALTNDGPGTVQYRIPNVGSAFWIDLQPTEVVTVNFIKGKIPSAAFRAQGANGTIRAVGTY